MKAMVDQDGCIGCELCVSICPSVFRMTESEKAEAYGDINSDNEQNARESADGCPVCVIEITED